MVRNHKGYKVYQGSTLFIGSLPTGIKLVLSLFICYTKSTINH